MSMHIIDKLKGFFTCRKKNPEVIINKFGEQLTIRGRMAYGLACLASYLRSHGTDWRLYGDEIELLASYTSSTDLPQWEQDVKDFLFSKYTDEQCQAGVPHILELLYYIGVGDMYGKYQGISAAELYSVVEILEKEYIPLPDMGLFSDYLLSSPAHDDDHYGSAFQCPDYFSR